MQWTTKDGEVIELSLMSDKHLLNSLRLVVEHHIDLSRNIEIAHSTEAFIHGDDASYTIDYDIRRMEDMEGHYIKVENDLREEVVRRGLKELSPRRKITDFDYANYLW